MQQDNTLAPILSEQSLLITIGGLFVLLVIAGICFVVLFKKDPSQIQASFRGGRGLHFATIIIVVFATTLLALERILSGEAVATILGGIIGYVLGSLKEEAEGKSENDRTT